MLAQLRATRLVEGLHGLAGTMEGDRLISQYSSKVLKVCVTSISIAAASTKPAAASEARMPAIELSSTGVECGGSSPIAARPSSIGA